MNSLTRALFCLVLGSVLNSGCASNATFKRIMKIDVPPGIRLEHEVISESWEFVVYSYHAVLSGDRASFLKMVQDLELSRATNFDQLVYLRPSERRGDARWWHPPSRQKQIFETETLEIYCDRVQRDPRKAIIEETSICYYEGKIYLFREYMRSVSELGEKQFRRISDKLTKSPEDHSKQEEHGVSH